MTIKSKIENVTDGFRNYGYEVTMEPIFGEEELFYNELRQEFDKLIAYADTLRSRYGLRGRSKRLLKMLHSDMPAPCWGVQLIGA